MQWTKPEMLNINQPEDKVRLEELKKSPGVIVHDQVNLAVEELYDIEFPHEKDFQEKSQFSEFRAGLAESGDLAYWGTWVYFAWSNMIVHFPPKKELRMLRTSRNRNLITAQEQSRLYEGTVLIGGLSVGSNVIEAMVSQGIGGKFIMADSDVIEPSNLNRIRAPYHETGVHKVHFVAKKVSEADPYIEQVHLLEGLDEHSLIEAIKSHSPDVLVDEMDDLEMKLKVREIAKSYSLPVVMAADNAENSLLDIERYDLDNELELFSGRVPEQVLDRIRQGNLSRPEIGAMIGQYFVGIENTTLQMLKSLTEVGKSLPSWPQLGGAAALSGVVVSYCVKKILLDQELNVGRFKIDIDNQLDPVLQSDKYQQEFTEWANKLAPK